MIRSFLVFLLVVAGGAGIVEAQTLSDEVLTRGATSAYYSFSDPGDITIFVSVWGNVRYPGLYEVSQQTQLSELVSLAGGPSIRERDARQDRTVQVRLSREEGGVREVVYDEKLENDIFIVKQDLPLKTGDVLMVDILVRQRFSLRDVFPVVAAIGTVALAIERISN
jgi:hypothetical protein